MPARIALPERLLGRPFHLDEADEAGVARHLLRPPAFRIPHRDVRVPTPLPDTPLLRAVAATLALPGSALLSGWTSLELWELPTPFGDPDPAGGVVFARLPRGRDRLRVRGIRVCLRRAHDSERLFTAHELFSLLPRTRYLRLQDPLSAWCDLAPTLPFVDGVALGDAVRARFASQHQMEAAVDARAGCPGAPALRRVAQAVRYRVDSPMETDTRLLLVGAGLPEPRCGQRVPDASGRRWRVDLLWLEYRVIVEYDGDVHRVKGLSQWRQDETKRHLLRDAGWTVVVLNGGDLSRTQPGRRAETVARVSRALRLGGWAPA